MRDVSSTHEPNWRFFVELGPGATAYFPLGVHALGAGDAVLITSDGLEHYARLWSWLLNVLQAVAVIGLVATAGRLLLPWQAAVAIDVVVMLALRLFAVGRTRQWGTPIPGILSRRICADALGRSAIVKEQMVAVTALLMVGSMTVLMLLGNQPVIMSIFITFAILSIDYLVCTLRLAAALPDKERMDRVDEFHAI